MITLLLLTIAIGIVIVESAVIYVAVLRGPQLAFDIANDVVGATIQKYMPELQPNMEGGRPQEGLMGFLNTPMGQQIAGMIMQKIQGTDLGKATSGNIYR